jgi:hypothetical protein
VQTANRNRMDMKIIINPHSRVTSKIRVDIYEKMTEFIIQTLKRKKEISLLDLLNSAEKKTTWNLGDEMQWYLLKVKQDLEARKVIRIKRDLREGTLQTIRLHHYKNFETISNLRIGSSI